MRFEIGQHENTTSMTFDVDNLVVSAPATNPAPTTLAITATIPAPTPKASGTVAPSSVAVSATIPAPTVSVRTTPAVRSAASTGVSAACTTGVTVTKPTGVADGDVLFAFVSKTNYSDTNAFTCSGWTEISSGTRGTTTGNDRHVTILRKVITNAAGEGSNYTFVTTFGTVCSMCATIVCVSGADTTTPEDEIALLKVLIKNAVASGAGMREITPAIEARMAQLAASGPPAEMVGLEPFGVSINIESIGARR